MTMNAALPNIPLVTNADSALLRQYRSALR
jgi:hypothetical protein